MKTTIAHKTPDIISPGQQGHAASDGNMKTSPLLVSIPTNFAKTGRSRIWPELRMVSLLSRGDAPMDVPGAPADATKKERHMLSTLLAWHYGLSEKTQKQARIISWGMILMSFLGIGISAYGAFSVYGLAKYGYSLECALWEVGGALLIISSWMALCRIERIEMVKESWVSVLTSTLNQKVWHSIPNDLKALNALLPQGRAEGLQISLLLMRACGVSDTFSMVRLALMLEEKAPRDGTTVDMSLDPDITEMVGRMHDALLSHQEEGAARLEAEQAVTRERELMAQRVKDGKPEAVEPLPLHISFPINT